MKGRSTDNTKLSESVAVTPSITVRSMDAFSGLAVSMHARPCNSQSHGYTHAAYTTPPQSSPESECLGCLVRYLLSGFVISVAGASCPHIVPFRPSWFSPLGNAVLTL